jgi:hypothetical protein
MGAHARQARRGYRDTQGSGFRLQRIPRDYDVNANLQKSLAVMQDFAWLQKMDERLQRIAAHR